MFSHKHRQAKARANSCSSVALARSLVLARTLALACSFSFNLADKNKQTHYNVSLCRLIRTGRRDEVLNLRFLEWKNLLMNRSSSLGSLRFVQYFTCPHFILFAFFFFARSTFAVNLGPYSLTSKEKNAR